MKILFISPNPPKVGPPDLDYLTKNLVKGGHTVTVFCPNINPYDKNRKLYKKTTVVNEEGVETIYFNSIFNFASLVITPELITNLRGKVGDFDIVHLYGVRHFQNLIGYWYTRQKRVPYVLVPRGTVTYHRAKVLRKALFDSLAGRKLLKNASGLVAFNELERQELVKMGCYRNKISVIPLGIDVDQFKALPAKGEFRKKYDINEQFIILFLGRIHYIKGLDYLIKAFAKVAKRYLSVRLVIAGGDYGYLAKLNQLIKQEKLESKVTFTGYISGRDKLEALVDADMLALPSRYDIFPNVILEALVCQTPVITTINCGLAEVVKSENLGKVTLLDEDKLAIAIEELMLDEDFRKSAGRKGKEFVSANFNIDKVCQMYETLYQSILTN